MDTRRSTVFMFPGQGAQYARMAAGLYGHAEPFTGVMDRMFTFFGTWGDRIRREWLASEPSALFDDVSIAQPLLYTVNYGLGAQAIELSVQPDVLIGHSVGELAAAALGGVFDFEIGLQILNELIDRCRDVPPGGMLAAAASIEHVQPHLTGDVVIGAVNGRRQLLISGPRDELEMVRQRLAEHGVTCRRTPAEQPFHSPAMGIASSEPRPWSSRLRKPGKRIFSCYTGKELDDVTATTASFWTAQPSSTVLFGPTLERLMAEGPCVLVQAGPGQNLTALARRLPAVRSGHSIAIPMLPNGPTQDPATDREAVAAILRHPALTTYKGRCGDREQLTSALANLESRTQHSGR